MRVRWSGNLLLSCTSLRANLSPVRLQAVVLMILAVFACSVEAKADPIVVGVVSFDSIIPDAGFAAGTNGFTIYNFTGSNSQPGTPDSALSFLNTSLLLDGTQAISIGEVDPGSVQPLAAQFSTTSLFTDVQFSATLDTTTFMIGGQNYLATSNQVTADLEPSSAPDLIAGTDFVVLQIDASPVNATPVPEPGSFWFVLGPVASLLWRRARHHA